jgi:SRSO17 transposase
MTRGFPKKGGTRWAWPGSTAEMLGKQDNCQAAVSVTLACDQGSLPVAWRLYLPEEWAVDPVRRTQGRRARRSQIRDQDADRAAATAQADGRRAPRITASWPTLATAWTTPFDRR